MSVIEDVVQTLDGLFFTSENGSDLPLAPRSGERPKKVQRCADEDVNRYNAVSIAPTINHPSICHQ